MYAAKELAKLGYEFRPGPTGQKSDWLLRQTADPKKGFVFKDQKNYEEVADAVVAFVQQQLTVLCDLLPYPLPATAAEANSVVYATSDFQEHPGPLLLLVCGSAPGGAAGVWGRSLCINSSLHEGAMFDYIFRAQTLGWAVVVANPNVNDIYGKSITGSESPHQHLLTLWKSYLSAAKASRILVVAHSYGAPTMVHLLKAEPEARERIAALALTDGGAFPPGNLLEEKVPTEEEVARSSKPSQLAALRCTLQRFAELAPLAFQAPAPEVAQQLARVARNFRADGRKPGTFLAAADASRDGLCEVSAGHELHPATTHSATEVVFEFLRRGAAGEAAVANDELGAA